MAVPNFGQMKELYGLQKKAKQMKKELESLEIEARSTDGAVVVVVSGDMKPVSIKIDEEYLNPDKKMILEKALKDTLTQAMAKAQSESAARIGPIMKDMNIPGM